MEVFSIFATLSLVDLVSGPLDRIRGAMGGVNASVASLGQRMGNLALAMAPVALAAGVMLGAFGMAASKAMAFESAMADVAKVVNFETQSEFQAMNKTVMDMAGRIPMAADGIAAIIAAAGQSGIAKQDLAEFAEQAAKMGVAFDLTGDQAGKSGHGADAAPGLLPGRRGQPPFQQHERHSPRTGRSHSARGRCSHDLRSWGNAGCCPWRGLPVCRRGARDSGNSTQEFHWRPGARHSHEQEPGRGLSGNRLFGNAAGKGYADRRPGDNFQGSGGPGPEAKRAAGVPPVRNVRAGKHRRHSSLVEEHGQPAPGL